MTIWTKNISTNVNYQVMDESGNMILDNLFDSILSEQAIPIQEYTIWSTASDFGKMLISNDILCENFEVLLLENGEELILEQIDTLPISPWTKNISTNSNYQVMDENSNVIYDELFDTVLSEQSIVIPGYTIWAIKTN